MSTPPTSPDPSGGDLTDGREKYDWKSKWPDEARKCIRTEALYLGGLLALVVPGLLFLTWEGRAGSILGLDAQAASVFRKYALAWVAGTGGGTLFSGKWLYHSVAHGWWHEDRRLWRLFTPHMSGALAFFAIALVSSGAVRLFDQAASDSTAFLVGAGFLIGYFSDNAIAKLSEIARILFGVREKSGTPSKA